MEVSIASSIVYDRCTTEQTRNDKGACVDTYSACDTFCPSGGEVSSTTGLCICDSITPLAEVVMLLVVLAHQLLNVTAPLLF